MSNHNDALRQFFHETMCSIEQGVLTHVDGSNESPHDGEHPHPWPCERMAKHLRDRNLNITAANWSGGDPRTFMLDPETGDEWPVDLDLLRREARNAVLDEIERRFVAGNEFGWSDDGEFIAEEIHRIIEDMRHGDV